MFEKVTYRCGHEGEIEVYGKADKRNYVVSMKERDLCPECYKKEQQKKIRAYNGSFLSLTGAGIDTMNIPTSVKRHPNT